MSLCFVWVRHSRHLHRYFVKHSDSAVPLVIGMLALSAAGIFPVSVAPYYAAAKGGLVHFTRSLASRLAPHGIQLAAICPQ
jgi:NAD(P)-dependent dehydrogenase (short-subunit alcohol dehydrogenase family)